VKYYVVIKFAGDPKPIEEVHDDRGEAQGSYDLLTLSLDIHRGHLAGRKVDEVTLEARAETPDEYEKLEEITKARAQ
jgi:hypothetical protein